MCTDFAPDRLRFAGLIPERVQKSQNNNRLSAYKYAVDNGNDIWLVIMLQIFAVNIVTRTIFNDHGHVALATFLHGESEGVKLRGQGQRKKISTGQQNETWINVF